MAYRLPKLGQYVRGRTGYFGISEYYRPIPKLEKWIRRRIRMCYLETMALAAHKDQAPAGLGRDLEDSDPAWHQQQKLRHMARTPAMQQALNNDWLTAQGVPSIKQLWCKAQGYSS